MCKGKMRKMCLIETENAVNSSAMDEFANEKQAHFNNFNLCSRFLKAFSYVRGKNVAG
jgi:hypothetical protein